MKLPQIAALSALAVVALTASASAAPMTGLAKAPAAESGVIQVHGRHTRCEPGRGGWHRSPRRGMRIDCRPPRKRGDHGNWRSEGPRRDWQDNRSRRWSR
ncbi:MAG TPA: hypothetical protein P5114_09370 [Hyphomicrobiaceae bacterium]|nr:hypothetical protein [Hyphomicrobiaceae bacterium]